MSTVLSGLGHATSFSGSDSLPVIAASRQYYNEDGFGVASVNATEHAVMCAGTKGDELGTFRRLMDTYPTGILSIVSDTWDLWTVVTDYLPTLKDEIMSRDGKIVIRPDSGDPVDILCGYNSLTTDEFKGKAITVGDAHPALPREVKLPNPQAYIRREVELVLRCVTAVFERGRQGHRGLQEETRSSRAE